MEYGFAGRLEPASVAARPGRRTLRRMAAAGLDVLLRGLTLTSGSDHDTLTVTDRLFTGLHEHPLPADDRPTARLSAVSNWLAVTPAPLVARREESSSPGAATAGPWPCAFRFRCR